MPSICWQGVGAVPTSRDTRPGCSSTFRGRSLTGGDEPCSVSYEGAMARKRDREPLKAQIAEPHALLDGLRVDRRAHRPRDGQRGRREHELVDAVRRAVARQRLEVEDL